MSNRAETFKAGELIVKAINSLNERDGSTEHNITDLIAREYDVEKEAARRPIMTALKRGVHFGFLKKRGMRYFLDLDEDFEDKIRTAKRRRRSGGKRRKGRRGGRKRRGGRRRRRR